MQIVVFDDLPEGGAKRVAFEHVRGLSENHVVDYVTNTIESSFPFQHYARSMTRFDMDLRVFNGAFRPLQELSYYYSLAARYQRIAHFIQSLRPDVVIVHPSRFSQAPPLLFFLTVPTIYFAEEWPRVVYEPLLHPLPQPWGKQLYECNRRRWLKTIDREAARAATMVLATSRYMQRQLHVVYQRPISLLPLGVDETLFCPNDGPQKHFLFVGEKEPINGYPLLRGMQEAYPDRFPIQYVTFDRGTFRYTNRKMRTLYQQAVATLCLAVNEPFGLTALESMSCATPVIAVREGGYMDTVQNGRNGISIPRQIRPLRNAMQLLVTNQPYRDMLGHTARQKVLTHFTWSRHILLLEKQLEKVSCLGCRL